MRTILYICRFWNALDPSFGRDLSVPMAGPGRLRGSFSRNCIVHCHSLCVWTVPRPSRGRFERFLYAVGLGSVAPGWCKKGVISVFPWRYQLLSAFDCPVSESCEVKSCFARILPSRSVPGTFGILYPRWMRLAQNHPSITSSLSQSLQPSPSCF